jgi:hypothetical protein
VFSIECLCKFRDRWTEVEGVPAQFDFPTAVVIAQQIAQQRNGPTRVVNDWGEQVWP